MERQRVTAVVRLFPVSFASSRVEPMPPIATQIVHRGESREWDGPAVLLPRTTHRGGLGLLKSTRSTTPCPARKTSQLSMMAGSKMAPFKGPNTDEPDQLSPDRQIRIATHGRSIQMCHKATSRHLPGIPY